MSLAEFKITNKLGEGAYSSVYKVQRVSDGDIYALKKVKLMNLSDKEKINALNEVRILASIRHPNIIGYKEAFLDEQSNSLCIVMEYCDGGDLFQKITQFQKKQCLFAEQEIFQIFLQIVKGLHELHSKKILHRDLKSANVFLCKDGTVKLGDMNVSKVAKKGLLYTQTGTPYYASPEVWKDTPYESKSDIWSLGCVLYEMTTLKPPFRAEDMEGLYKMVIRGNYPKIPSHFSQDLSNVIRTLLQVTPHLRPSADKILQMPAVQRHLEEHQFFEVDEIDKQLMQTIRIPRNLHYLTDRLPKPNYAPLKMKKVDRTQYIQSLSKNHHRIDQNYEFSEGAPKLLLPKISKIPIEKTHKKYNNHRQYSQKVMNIINNNEVQSSMPLQDKKQEIVQQKIAMENKDQDEQQSFHSKGQSRHNISNILSEEVVKSKQVSKHQHYSREVGQYGRDDQEALDIPPISNHRLKENEKENHYEIIKDPVHKKQHKRLLSKNNNNNSILEVQADIQSIINNRYSNQNDLLDMDYLSIKNGHNRKGYYNNKKQMGNAPVSLLPIHSKYGRQELSMDYNKLPSIDAQYVPKRQYSSQLQPLNGLKKELSEKKLGPQGLYDNAGVRKNIKYSEIENKLEKNLEEIKSIYKQGGYPHQIKKKIKPKKLPSQKHDLLYKNNENLL